MAKKLSVYIPDDLWESAERLPRVPGEKHNASALVQRALELMVREQDARTAALVTGVSIDHTRFESVVAGLRKGAQVELRSAAAAAANSSASTESAGSLPATESPKRSRSWRRLTRARPGGRGWSSTRRSGPRATRSTRHSERARERSLTCGLRSGATTGVTGARRPLTRPPRRSQANEAGSNQQSRDRAVSRACCGGQPP